MTTRFVGLNCVLIYYGEVRQGKSRGSRMPSQNGVMGESGGVSKEG